MASKKSSPKNRGASAPDEQIFRLMFEGHSAIMLLIEPQTGNILDANQSAVDFYGYTKSKLCGMTIQEITTLPPEQVAVERQKILNGKQKYSVFQHRLASGEVRVVEIHLSPIALHEKQMLFSIIHDITARRQAEEALRESESRFRALFDQMAVGVARIETQTGKFIQVNQKDYDIVGYSREEMESLDFQSITHPDDLQADLENMEQLKSGTVREYTMEKRLIHKNGSIVWVALTVSPMWVSGAVPDFHIAIVQDITERKQAEEALKESEERYRTLIEWSPEAMAVYQDGKLIYLNPAAIKVLGVISTEELAGKSALDLIHPDFHQMVLARIKNSTDTGVSAPLTEMQFLKVDGNTVNVESHAMPIVYNGKPSMIVVFRDITARKQGEDELKYAKEKLEAANLELQAAFEHEQYLAHTDVLTGVNNRRYLFELAEHEFEVAKRYQRPLSVIMFDLDHFKQINDTFGHAAGDQMLESVIQAVCAQLRDVDLIGRYGGEEFIIILPMTSAQHAYPLAERIRISVAALRVKTSKSTVTVTLSIGVAEINHAAQDTVVENVIRRADQALYAAKQAGRNRTVVFDPNVTGAT